MTEEEIAQMWIERNQEVLAAYFKAERRGYCLMPFIIPVPERILGVAHLVVQTGEIVKLPQGCRHHDIIRYMDDTGTYTQEEIGGAEQGFYTNYRDYVSRRAGMFVALVANQLIEEPFQPGVLFSENLW